MAAGKSICGGRAAEKAGGATLAVDGKSVNMGAFPSCRGECPTVLIDVRTYNVKPGTLPKQLKIYEEHGWATQCKHLGAPLAFLTTETGADVNCYIHIWVYDSAEDRMTKRAAMMADPAWQRYKQIDADAGYLLKQENRLMTPAAFAAIKR